MKVKKLLTPLFAILLLLSQSILVNAEATNTSVLLNGCNNIISPQWINVNDVNINLYFENGEANCSGFIRALSGTTNIDATFKLERKTSSGWVLEKAWSMSSNSNRLSFFNTYEALSGYSYRFSVIADIIRDGVIETVNSSVESKY